MKDPLPLNNIWNKSIPQDRLLVPVPGISKKFKRKSREPKKLFTGPDSEKIKIYSATMLAADPADDNSMGMCRVNDLSSVQRQLVMSPESTAGTAGLLSEQSDKVAAQASGAIDMRVGINMPAITPKMSQFPSSPFPEISHWPTSISQPLSNRLKLSLQSSFSLSASSSSGQSPSQQAFSLEPTLAGQSVCFAVPRASQSSQCQEQLEPQISSPKESPRKRIGGSADEAGCIPEVKAIQQTRRLLANARERTRVHTISAAFEALRKQVPCYSYGQKLSKLAILRIACNYILSLAQLAELDYSSDRSSLTFSQCVEQCTRTLQAEGRSKKRKVGRIPEDV